MKELFASLIGSHAFVVGISLQMIWWTLAAGKRKSYFGWFFLIAAVRIGAAWIAYGATNFFSLQIEYLVKLYFPPGSESSISALMTTNILVTALLAVLIETHLFSRYTWSPDYSKKSIPFLIFLRQCFFQVLMISILVFEQQYLLSSSHEFYWYSRTGEKMLPNAIIFYISSLAFLISAWHRDDKAVFYGYMAFVAPLAMVSLEGMVLYMENIVTPSLILISCGALMAWLLFLKSAYPQLKGIKKGIAVSIYFLCMFYILKILIPLTAWSQHHGM